MQFIIFPHKINYVLLNLTEMPDLKYRPGISINIMYCLISGVISRYRMMKSPKRLVHYHVTPFFRSQMYM